MRTLLAVIGLFSITFLGTVLATVAIGGGFKIGLNFLKILGVL